ncbi:MAG: hypothetical protein V3V28_12530 [Polaribacter sp.]|uniref:hypothetical protein n=1 Tax=Polaribacter sp. TaxID=1920175 RepID=UPI002F354F5A
MTSHIYFNENSIKQFEIKNSPNYFLTLNRINVFAGVNNSGKSRLIRTLFSDEKNVQYYKKDITEKQFESIKSYFKNQFANSKKLADRNGLILKKEYDFHTVIHKTKNEDYLSFFYEDSSGNIVETDSFIALIPNQSDRDNIRNILINEQNGNNDAKGEKC